MAVDTIEGEHVGHAGNGLQLSRRLARIDRTDRVAPHVRRRRRVDGGAQPDDSHRSEERVPNLTLQPSQHRCLFLYPETGNSGGKMPLRLDRRTIEEPIPGGSLKKGVDWSASEAAGTGVWADM